MPAVASSAPAVLIGHLADATTTLRVGAGGVMLPNHAPLVIAEQYATLEALHPGRIDLGLGRAPGTDQVTARALRRVARPGAGHLPPGRGGADRLPGRQRRPVSHPAPVPGRGYLPEVWLLGSSTFSAQLAGLLGLPFSFAYHFAPDLLDQAVDQYRRTFRPSVLLGEPYFMPAVSVLCAPTDEEARWLAGPSALTTLQLRTGRLGPVPSPEQAAAYRYTDQERAFIDATVATHLIGEPESVQAGLVALQARTGADEIMLSTRAHSLAARVQSLTLVAGRWPTGGDVAAPTAASAV